jgi:hypothetical protein
MWMRLRLSRVAARYIKHLLQAGQPGTTIDRLRKEPDGRQQMSGIGLLSTIDYSADMQTSFQAGFRSVMALPYVTTQAQIGYNAGALGTAINTLNTDATLNANPQSSLIVTFGGFIACNAAILGSNFNFISLVGGLPAVPVPSGRFAGCCNLASFLTDQDRIDWLSDPANAGHFPNGAAFPTANIGLLYNRYSTMAPLELTAWRAAGGGQAVAADQGWATPGNFNLDFNQFSNTIQAIVISADPYFHRHRNDLISAANGSTKYICYPLLSYRNLTAPAANQPTPGNAVVYGPDLHQVNPAVSTTAAYYQMGVMAATAIGTPLPLARPVVPIAQVIRPL